MGIASLLLGENNPFAQWAGQNQNFLGAIGAGLGQGQNLQSGLAAGLAQLPQAKQLDQAAAEKLKADKLAENQANASKNWLRANHPDLAQMVQAGMPVSEAWSTAMQRMQPQGGNDYDTRYQAGQQYGLQGDELNTFALTGAVPGTSRTNVTYGTTPVWGQDSSTGKSGYGVTGSDGSFKLVDTGSFQPMGPGDVAQDRASGTLLGKADTQATIDLPGAIAKGEYAVKQLEGLLSTVADPTTGAMVPNAGFEDQFGTFLGIPTQQMLPAIPNTPKAGFQARLSQVQGQAFLQAFESLKGGGAISEVEGLKAQQAILRASTSQSRDDFETAIKEAIDIYNAGLQRARDRVRLGSQGAAQQVLNGGGADPVAAADTLLNSGKY